jgi:hypothetical protein
VVEPTGTTAGGIPIYDRLTKFGFIVFVEGRPGASGQALSTFGTMDNEASGSDRAHLQIQADRALGNGSALVCDRGPLPDPIGGVPGVNPPDFGPSQAVTDLINDFACRFDFHPNSSQACTLDKLGNFAFASEEVVTQTRQYCTAPALGKELALLSGETLLSVQLVDAGGNIGDLAQLIIRVP